MFKTMIEVLRSPEGEGGSATTETTATETTATDTTDAPLLTGKVEEAETEQTSEWAEYVPDPAKSEDENAAAKAEHDKTKPAEQQEEKTSEVPEKYDIQLGEGIQLDEALLEKATPVMRELGLTNEQANKLAGVIAEQRKADYDALNARHQKVVTDWQTAIKTDKDFGGEKLKTSLNTADRVIATFGDDEFRKDLTDLGLGNHPGLFRLLARVGNALSDDKPVTSETPAATVKKDLADTLYGPTG